MTKEELKQEAEEKAKKRTKGFKCQENCEKSYVMGALDFAEPREKRIAELEAENERIKTKYYELQDTLKKVRLALIKERTANIMNYGKGGVEMFDSMFEILKGVSN